MVLSGNDHLNDRNYCNWAAIECFSRFQRDKQRSGVCLWCEGCVGLSKDGRRRCKRARILLKKDYRCCELLIFLSFLFFFSAALPESLSPPPPPSLPLFTLLSALFCFALLSSLLRPPHVTLATVDCSVRADQSKERERERGRKRDMQRERCRGGGRVGGESSDRLSVFDLSWFPPPCRPERLSQETGPSAGIWTCVCVCVCLCVYVYTTVGVGNCV